MDGSIGGKKNSALAVFKSALSDAILLLAVAQTFNFSWDRFGMIELVQRERSPPQLGRGSCQNRDSHLYHL
jgi:hypothetical protein